MSELAENRDAVLLAIVDRLANAEGKAGDTTTGFFHSFTYDRAWLLEAFACARECLDGPPKKPLTFTSEDTKSI